MKEVWIPVFTGNWQVVISIRIVTTFSRDQKGRLSDSTFTILELRAIMKSPKWGKPSSVTCFQSCVRFWVLQEDTPTVT